MRPRSCGIESSTPKTESGPTRKQQRRRREPDVLSTVVRPSPLPLQAVLFPGGLLSLKVFEARYLDLVGHCLRESKAFGVVALKQGSDTGMGRSSSSRAARWPS
jgi:Lon protease-like protein